MAYEDYTIRQFLNAWFKDDRSVMTDEILQQVKTEYIDAAGLYESEEFDKVAYIHYLNGRINWIKMAIRLQKEFINNFDIPYIPDLENFKRYGHIVYWNKDKDKFLETLNKVQSKESRYISQVEKELKELKEMRLSKNRGEENSQPTREGIIRTINSLGKCGFRISQDKTYVDEFALMIKQQKEDNESLKSKH